LASLLASVTKQQQQPVFNDPASDIQLNHHSLKVFHPHLLPLIHEDLGPPCTQCGRRFRTDEEGKRKKTAHMDWHFRVHQRIAEAERRGQHRSWYVDDQDWVHSKEVIDVDYVAPEASNIPDQQGGPDGRREGGQKAKKLQYIPVPEDSRVNSVCPICQEKFEMKWLDEAQEWVWMDALRTGDRAYHASCYGEAMGTSTSGGGDQAARGGTPARGTPEPGVLGKRKAEDQLVGVKKEVKLEY
jgi:pre-mRNA cleavage complex 2 protein Pcf11